MERAAVGVFPAGQIGKNGSLWNALGTAFGVTFVDGDSHRGALDGAVGVGSEAVPPDVPALVTAAAAVRSSRPSPVRFADNPDVDARLRSKALPESGASDMEPVAVAAQGRALATGPTGPLWSIDGRGQAACAAALPILASTERLKDHLRAGRFLALTAITHLLRTVTGYAEWQPPALRATITFDDPNLRRRSYGFLRFADLADHASRHGYHVGIATVPADAGPPHPETVRLFRRADHLSLVVHGNNHVHAELLEEDPARALALAAQSVRRVAAFEARSGLRVGRVMVPPHGACSQTVMRALRRVGYDAISYTGPRDRDALVGWASADLHVGGGLPGLQRVALDCGSDELTLRAFLDQPLCLFGHHSDIAEGLDRLALATARVADVGPARWGSLVDLARSNFSQRLDGTTLHVRLHTRRAVVEVPEGVEDIVVEPVAGEPDAVVRAVGDHRLEVGVPPSAPVRVDDVAAPVWRPWPVVRRAVVEGRDRLLPLVRWTRSQPLP